MGKTSSKVKDRYNEKTYDRITLRVKKGEKETIEKHAQGKGQSLNGYINGLIKKDMGESEEE